MTGNRIPCVNGNFGFHTSHLAARECCQPGHRVGSSDATKSSAARTVVVNTSSGSRETLMDRLSGGQIEMAYRPGDGPSGLVAENGSLGVLTAGSWIETLRKAGKEWKLKNTGPGENQIVCYVEDPNDPKTAGDYISAGFLSLSPEQPRDSQSDAEVSNLCKEVRRLKREMETDPSRSARCRREIADLLDDPNGARMVSGSASSSCAMVISYESHSTENRDPFPEGDPPYGYKIVTNMGDTVVVFFQPDMDDGDRQWVNQVDQVMKWAGSAKGSR